MTRDYEQEIEDLELKVSRYKRLFDDQQALLESWQQNYRELSLKAVELAASSATARVQLEQSQKYIATVDAMLLRIRTMLKDGYTAKEVNDFIESHIVWKEESEHIH